MRELAFVFLSALLFVLGQPNVLFEDGLFFLSFVALLPAFYAVQGIALQRSFFLGFLFGLEVYVGMCFWLARYSHVLFFIAIIFYSLLYGLVFFTMKLLSLAYPAFSFPVMALVFCVFEYLKSLGPLGFSYGIIGYSQWTCRPLLLTASVGGVWISSSFCAFFSAFSAEFLTQYPKGLKRRNLFSFLFLLLLAGSFSLLGFQISCLSFESKDITVVLVQNNADSSKYEDGVYKADIADLVALSEEALSVYPDADFVVWPETAVVPPLLHHYESRSDIARFNAVSSVLGVILRSKACFVIGNQHVDDEEGDCNAALVFDQEKGPVLPPNPEIYVKQQLVPFTESLPFYTAFKALYDRAFPDQRFIWKAGESSGVFHCRGVSFSVPICFEDSFGSLCAQFVRGGAECLFSICNDSWASSPVCQRQHLAMSAFRAAENGVPVCRSCASGVTCVIDAEGRVVDELDGFCGAFLGKKLSVPVQHRLYPYTFYGDWFAQTELILLCILSAWALIKKHAEAVESKRGNGVE